MAGADELGFELLPADDSPLSDAAALDAAAAGALADPGTTPVAADDAPEPFGRTCLFDFEAGRYVRRGGEPVWVTGFEALKQWCLMALHSARYSSAVFSDEFGVEGPNEPVGVAGEAAFLVADDFRVHAVEALLVHDRIAAASLTVVYDPVAGLFSVGDLLVVTDEDVALPFDDLTIPALSEA